MACGACGSTGPQTAPTTLAPTTTSTSTTSTSTTTTTVPLTPANGPETVLSPIGLNIRVGPSKSAAVRATVVQGTVLQVLGRTSEGGGWYKVQGTTVTGWISSNPSLSAPGRFSTYTAPSGAFSVLFPATWTAAGSPKAGVAFKSPTPPEKVVITTASKLAKLPWVRQGGGVAQNSSQQVVACGVTAYLFTYTTSSSDRYMAYIALRLDATHALGMRATLTSLSQMPTLSRFVNSVSFPFPECVGGPPHPAHAPHAKTAKAAKAAETTTTAKASTAPASATSTSG